MTLPRQQSAIKSQFNRLTANQITIQSPNGKQTRTLRVVEAETGKLSKQFEFPYTPDTSLKSCFINKDGAVLLNFDSTFYDIYEKGHYKYWVGYDTNSKKVLWLTDFNSQSDSSLFHFVNERMRIEQ